MPISAKTENDLRSSFYLLAELRAAIAEQTLRERIMSEPKVSALFTGLASHIMEAVESACVEAASIFIGPNVSKETAKWVVSTATTNGQLIRTGSTLCVTYKGLDVMLIEGLGVMCELGSEATEGYIGIDNENFTGKYHYPNASSRFGRSRRKVELLEVSNPALRAVLENRRSSILALRIAKEMHSNILRKCKSVSDYRAIFPTIDRAMQDKQSHPLYAYKPTSRASARYKNLMTSIIPTSTGEQDEQDEQNRYKLASLLVEHMNNTIDNSVDTLSMFFEPIHPSAPTLCYRINKDMKDSAFNVVYDYRGDHISMPRGGHNHPFAFTSKLVDDCTTTATITFSDPSCSPAIPLQDITGGIHKLSSDELNELFYSLNNAAIWEK